MVASTEEHFLGRMMPSGLALRMCAGHGLETGAEPAAQHSPHKQQQWTVAEHVPRLRRLSQLRGKSSGLWLELFETRAVGCRRLDASALSAASMRAVAAGSIRAWKRR
jgi:hypothetical protein